MSTAEHRLEQTCSSSPSSSLSSSPPFTSRSPGRRVLFLLVPQIAPKLQGARRDAIRACLPPFLLCRVLVLRDPPPPPRRCRAQLDQPNCVCTNAAFFGAASGCVWLSCSAAEATTAEDFWLGVCSAYMASLSGNHSPSIIDPPFIDNS